MVYDDSNCNNMLSDLEKNEISISFDKACANNLIENEKDCSSSLEKYY